MSGKNDTKRAYLNMFFSGSKSPLYMSKTYVSDWNVKNEIPAGRIRFNLTSEFISSKKKFSYL